MKFLVLGAGGMAGHIISVYLNEKGHDVTGFALNQLTFCKTEVGDAQDKHLLTDIIGKGKFDSVINCIGILNQFADRNKGLAIYLNSYLPHFLAEITAETPAQIIHMSTDCVFSGKRGLYTESDNPDGESVYDKTKALGELNDNKNVTFRNSIVGPDINESGIGLFNWFMKQTGPIKGYTSAIWTGLTTLQLAKVMESAAKERVSGLFNMVYDEPVNKFELLSLFNKYFRSNQIIIEPYTGVELNKSLKRTNFSFDFQIPDYDIMVHELSKWVSAHKYLYPHYQL